MQRFVLGQFSSVVMDSVFSLAMLVVIFTSLPDAALRYGVTLPPSFLFFLFGVLCSVHFFGIWLGHASEHGWRRRAHRSESGGEAESMDTSAS